MEDEDQARSSRTYPAIAQRKSGSEDCQRTEVVEAEVLVSITLCIKDPEECEGKFCYCQLLLSCTYLLYFLCRRI